MKREVSYYHSQNSIKLPLTPESEFFEPKSNTLSIKLSPRNIFLDKIV